MHGLPAELPLAGDPPGPVDDPGRGDAPLVHPGLVPAKGRVGDSRPARPEAQKSLPRSRLGRGIVALAADHDLGRGAVVAQKHHQGVLEGTHRLELRGDPADLAVHHVHHRGVDRHLRGLELPLFVGQRVPRPRPVQLAGPEPLEHLGLGLVGGTDVGLGLRRRRGHDPRLPQSRGPRGADGIPASQIPLAVPGDHLGRRLHRKVGRREGDIVKERRAGMVAGVLGQALDRVVADGRRHIEVVAGRDRLSVLGHAAGVEIVALARIEHVERPREALSPWVAVDVPLA